jgi:hypothetical protein
MANHSRWCYKNPKRQTYSNNTSKARAAKKNFRNQHSAGTFKGHSEETIRKWKESSTGRKHTAETKLKIKTAALSSKHRRLKKNTVVYKGILLDSTWELELAKRLDDLNIRWRRPDPLPWIDEIGLIHNYFPDFYLPDHDVYLDPKNPHAIRVQNKKLTLLLNQYSNIHIIDSLDGCMNFNI